MTLHYGYGKDVVASETFTLDAGDAPEGSLLPRFWAQQKSAALSLFPDKNAEALAQLGKQFNLVTANSSLLVLESVDQYVQYRVVPPASQPEIYKEFLARIEQGHAQEARSREEKLQQVAGLWNARVQWWEQERKYPANLKVNEAGGKFGEAVAGNVANIATASPTTQPQGVAAADHTVYGMSRPRAPIAHNAQGQQQAAQQEDRAVRAAVGRDTSELQSRFAAGRDEASVRLRTAPGAEGYGSIGDDSIAIAIKTWDPKTPYIVAMKAVSPEKARMAFT